MKKRTHSFRYIFIAVAVLVLMLAACAEEELGSSLPESAEESSIAQSDANNSLGSEEVVESAIVSSDESITESSQSASNGSFDESSESDKYVSEAVSPLFHTVLRIFINYYYIPM